MNRGQRSLGTALLSFSSRTVPVDSEGSICTRVRAENLEIRTIESSKQDRLLQIESASVVSMRWTLIPYRVRTSFNQITSLIMTCFPVGVPFARILPID